MKWIFILKMKAVRVYSGKLARMISLVCVKELELVVKNLPTQATHWTDDPTWWIQWNILGANDITNSTPTLLENRCGLLLTEYLCPCKIHVSNEILTPQCDVNQRWSLWEMIRSWRWSSHEWEYCPLSNTFQRDLWLSLPYEDMLRRPQFMNQKLGTHQKTVCRRHDLGLPRTWELHVCWLSQPVYGIWITAVSMD